MASAMVGDRSLPPPGVRLAIARLFSSSKRQIRRARAISINYGEVVQGFGEVKMGLNTKVEK